MAIVVDASLAGAWFLPDEASQESETVLDMILSGGEDLLVPDLWAYELANLFLVARLRGRLSEDQILQADRLLNLIPCFYHPLRSDLLRDRVRLIAKRYQLSAYDAAYLELADRHQCPLHTLDRRLHDAAERMGLASKT